MAKQRYNFTLEPDTRERLEQYVREKHLPSVSAAIEFLVWNVVELKNSEVSVQKNMADKK